MLGALRVVVPVLLLSAAACARSGGNDEPKPTEGRVYVYVANQHALPMEVYATSKGINHRLGTVHPGMRSQFFLPQNLTGGGSVRFEARPSGGGQPFRSEDLLLSPGAIVEFNIATQLFNSTVSRRY